MSITPYNRTRYEAGRGMFDWQTQPMMAVIPAATYLPDLINDQTMTVAQPFRSTPVQLMEQSVDPAGWLKSSPINLGAVPINSAFNHVIIYRLSDSALMFLHTFPAIISTTGQPVTLYYGIANNGFGRL